MATRAIILAAGRGSRLYEMDRTPKPLVCVAGQPLLFRTIESLAGGGAIEAVIVVGYEADTIRSVVRSWTTSIPVRFVDNPRWEGQNGLSVLAAASEIEHGSFLSMSDHILSPDIVRAVAGFALPEGQAVLGVDRNVDCCFDIDDATKVLLGNGGIAQIGKDLPDYDAIDTGLFRIGPELVRELVAVEQFRGDASLSDGVRALAAMGKMSAVDIGKAFWLDVDTPQAFEYAQRCLGARSEQ